MSASSTTSTAAYTGFPNLARSSSTTFASSYVDSKGIRILTSQEFYYRLIDDACGLRSNIYFYAQNPFLFLR